MRRANNPNTTTSKQANTVDSNSSDGGDKEQRPRLPSWVGFLILFVSFLGAIITLYFILQGTDVSRTVNKVRIAFVGERTFTKSELANYDGTDENLPVYIAVKGRVYDVTAGKKHYGPSGSYHIFAGKDASRSFVDGCFSPECVENAGNLDGLTDKQMEEIDNWVKFYDTHKQYFFVGKLVQENKT